jgi:hypothetical protein
MNRVLARVRDVSGCARRILLGVGLLLAIFYAAGCGRPQQHDDGLLQLGLSSAGLTVSSVAWKVQTGAMPPAIVRSGTINTSDANATASVFTSIPAGTGYVAVLTADIVPPTGNPAFCTGTSAPFDIIAGQQRMVTVQLVCGGSTPTQGNGSGNINGTVVAGDNCPLLTSWMASPLQVSAPAGQIDVSATATDADVTEVLTYKWTATAGTFVNAAAATTKYTCTTVGPQTLTVTVTDNHVPTNCSVSQTFPVTCANTAFCGNGVVDPGTNEQCDPPKPGFCGPTCQIIPGECSDGILQPGEQCDPPMPGFCSPTCMLIPAACGDGFVQAGEACDPPNLSTCTGSMCCNANCQIQTFDVSPQCQACETKTYSPSSLAGQSCNSANFSETPGSVGCAAFTGAMRSTCTALLACIRSTGCSAGDDPTPCYCGSLTPTACFNNGAPSTAPCFAEYNAAQAADPAGTVFGLFTDPTSPIGAANNLVTCDVDASCPCGQSGGTDNCPAISSATGSPMQAQAPNGVITVSASATDADPGDVLSYQWTATAGTFMDPTLASTKYTCTSPGTQTIFVTVTDNHVPSCSREQIFMVTCTPPQLCGNGVVDPGEQCDPPSVGCPFVCDSNCHTIASVCGDNCVEPGEQCDPPQPGVCSASCTFVPTQCGDGVIESGEQCDPPTVNPANLAASTCTTSQCCGATCLLQTFDVSPQCEACESKTYSPSSQAGQSCNSASFSQTPGSVGCAAFTGAMRSTCTALLACIRSTGCSAGDDPTPCYCGSLTSTACFNNGAPSTAPCFAEYNAAQAADPTGTVFGLFSDPTSPIGAANNLVTCDVDASCPCGQTGGTDNCPVISSAMGSPMQAQAPNGVITVSASATDADPGDVLSYQWTATAGTFANPTLASTQYTCTSSGTQTIFVTVTDNHVPSCSREQTFTVTCTPPQLCGNGVVDPGEQCDPPSVGCPFVCDSTCHTIASVCGDGCVEPGEQCDPPQPGVCTPNCTFVPIQCGNGVVDPGEQCDPPTVNPANLAASSCTTSQCCGATCQLQTFDVSPQCEACESKKNAAGSCDPSNFSQTAGSVGCAAFTGAIKSACTALLACIRSTHCSAGDDPTPCYCGALTPTACFNNGAPSTAPCFAQYNAAQAADPVGSVFGLFTDPTTPIGVADNVVSCDVDSTCPCGQ